MLHSSDLQLFRIYLNGGIWSLIQFFMIMVEARDWTLSIPLSHTISRFHIKDKESISWSDISLADNSVQNLEYKDGFEMRIQDATIARIDFKGKADYLDTDLSWVSETLGVFLESEALYPHYPTLVPFFLPASGDMLSINQEIQKKRNITFLNGKRHTGKKTFMFLSLQFQFQLNIKVEKLLKSTKDGVYYDSEFRFLIIAELASLTNEKQKNVLEDLKSERFLRVFICSIYDPKLLLDQGYLDNQLYQICIQNRIPFPSQRNRNDDLDDTLAIWKNFKINSIIKEKFGELENNTPFLRGNLGRVSSDKKLREMIGELEIQAIRQAQKAVGNSQNRIAKFLGISRGSLQHKLKKYNLLYSGWPTND